MANFITHTNTSLLSQRWFDQDFLLGMNLLPHEWTRQMNHDEIAVWGKYFRGWGYCKMSGTLVMQLVGWVSYKSFYGTFLWNGKDYGFAFTDGEKCFFWKFPEYSIRESFFLRTQFREGLSPYVHIPGYAQPEALVKLGEDLAAQAGQTHAFRVLLPWGELYSSK